ncbi:MAG: glycosyl transferase [Verrucomicrobia bacterium]|nr:glycosyl transferase [Verrucomicrobiota bacterium]
MNLRSFARTLGLGRLALVLWHNPWSRLRDSWRNGGPWVERENERQRREMEAAAAMLPPLPARDGAAEVTLHVLTGRRFWYQTAFCLHSFARQAEFRVAAEIYDDGSCDQEVRSLLSRLGPRLRFHSYAEQVARLDQLLPASRFHTLRDRWQNYPHIRKLIAPHLGSTGWKLVIDSDLLFFRRPDFLLEWLRQPERILHAVDCEENYGYSRPVLEHLAGAPLPPLVNVGLCGLRSESLDWAELEAWCTELIRRERTSYYLEQALVAMLAARAQPCAVAPAADYLTRPGKEEGIHPRAVMHHYVAESRRWYFRHGWRRVTEKGPAP